MNLNDDLLNEGKTVYIETRKLIRKTLAHSRNPASATHMVSRRSQACRRVGRGSGAPIDR